MSVRIITSALSADLKGIVAYFETPDGNNMQLIPVAPYADWLLLKNHLFLKDSHDFLHPIDFYTYWNTIDFPTRDLHLQTYMERQFAEGAIALLVCNRFTIKISSDESATQSLCDNTVDSSHRVYADSLDRYTAFMSACSSGHEDIRA